MATNKKEFFNLKYITIYSPLFSQFKRFYIPLLLISTAYIPALKDLAFQMWDFLLLLCVFTAFFKNNNHIIKKKNKHIVYATIYELNGLFSRSLSLI